MLKNVSIDLIYLEYIHLYGIFPIMKNVVYRNQDKYVLTRLLKEIGEHTLRKHCTLIRVPFPKRLRLFFLESNDECTFLKYNYQQGPRVVMKVDGYELPERGWERIKIQ